MERTFIQDWLNRAGTEGEDPDFEDVSILCKDIWEQIHQAVSLYHLCASKMLINVILQCSHRQYLINSNVVVTINILLVF